MRIPWKCTVLVPLALLVLAVPAGLVHGDEGMWLFNNPPRQILKERYGFDPTPEWLEHVQKASVRFNSGGSGSFVSADGLVMTNHHVGADSLQKFGDEKHNYLRDGFYAKTRSEEKRCLDLELNVLMSIQDVTDQVNAAVKPNVSPADAFAARRKVMSEIEKKSQDETGLRSDVITLYQGGLYHLYRFKRYTDVRLVFAPEQQAAFYGGDPDNFEYPRYDLDICFFRVYENDKPLKTEHYLTWSPNGAAKDELVFVPGHPGRTDRLATMDDLMHLRDEGLPGILRRMYRLEVLLGSFSARSDENARQAREDLFYVQNVRKARDGGEAGLLDPAIMKAKRESERKLRERITQDPKLKDALQAWDKVAQAEKVRAANGRTYSLLETANGFRRSPAGFNSDLFRIARTLLRAAEEKPKPNGDRLREFADSSLASLELQLFSEEPIYDRYEEVRLTDSLIYLNEQLGPDHELVKRIMAGKAPAERAVEVIKGTKLKDIVVRKKLYEGGRMAVEAAHDPMIELAKIVDPSARAVRKTIETQVDEVERQAYAQVARAKFALEGNNAYPDATFTLRLAYGVVKGYEEEGKQIPYQTTFAGLYERAKEHENKPPFDLPPRWIERKSKLNPDTPFNFVCTADIIGGNSGSPVINRKGEFVGIIFDGNIQSLVLDYIYTEKQARAVSVCSPAITEALRKVYDANDLADELTNAKK